jgi:type IV secretory pathway VirB2 component (pilin)
MRLHLPLRMNMTPRLSMALVCAAALTGCANMSESERGAAQGAAIGAVAGAILSSATGGSAGTGAVMGGAAGAVGGHLWSQRMQDKQRAMEQATRGSGVQVTRTADDQLKLQVPSDISFAVGSATLEPRLRPVLDAFANGTWTATRRCWCGWWPPTPRLKTAPATAGSRSSCATRSAAATRQPY